MLDFIEEWGRRLAAGAFIYTMIALIVVWGYAAAGLNPPELLPPNFIKLYAQAAQAYQELMQAAGHGITLWTLFVLAAAIGNTMYTLLVSLASFMISYIWLAVLVSRSLPGPLVVLAPIVWAAGTVAETILLLYLVKSFMDFIEWLRGFAPTTTA